MRLLLNTLGLFHLSMGAVLVHHVNIVDLPTGKSYTKPANFSRHYAKRGSRVEHVAGSH